MKKEKKSKNFIDKPLYDGGPKAMAKFIDSQLQYPKEAQEAGIKGTVVVRYTIDYQGKVIETKIISGIGHGCDEEAQRVIKLLKFNMGSYRNMKIQFHKTIKVHFRAKKVKTKPAAKTVSYSYVASPKTKTTNQTSPKKSGYSYTITIKKKA